MIPTRKLSTFLFQKRLEGTGRGHNAEKERYGMKKFNLNHFPYFLSQNVLFSNFFVES